MTSVLSIKADRRTLTVAEVSDGWSVTLQGDRAPLAEVGAMVGQDVVVLTVAEFDRLRAQLRLHQQKERN